MLVAAYWGTNLTMRQLAPLFRVSKSAADRIIDHLGPMLALQPRKRFAMDTVLIVDGTLVPTRDHAVAEQSKNYRYSTNHQVVIDADTRRVVVVGQPLPRRRMARPCVTPPAGCCRFSCTSTLAPPKRLPTHGQPTSHDPGTKPPGRAAATTEVFCWAAPSVASGCRCTPPRMPPRPVSRRSWRTGRRGP
ncbi:hypothetical protein GCM10010271_60340 [Streptomyces kurssanovii]|nr:hypothetical protein GCM10010271_60340 [Streptomyces kurssanovii]